MLARQENRHSGNAAKFKEEIDMSKNLKTLICCVLALVFVAGTIVAVFADSTGAFTREAESVTGEVEESTGLEEDTSVPTTEAPSEEPTTEYTGRLGDVDKNGKIEAVDARLVLRFAAQLQAYDEYEGWAADVITDGKIVAADARIILRVAAQLESESYFGTQKALDDYHNSIIIPGETTTVVEEDSSAA